MGDKRITISDIAKATGYSNTTVSRALSGNGRVPEKTKEIIRKQAQLMEYHPNSTAVSLSHSRAYNIGIIFPNIESISQISFFYKCLIGITTQLQETDYSPMLFYDDDQGQIGNSIKRIIENNKVDAVIIMRSYNIDDRIEYFHRNKIPVVLIGKSQKSISQIDYNHRNASKKAVLQAISDNDIRNILYISNTLSYTVNTDRYGGYLDALEESGNDINSDTIITTNYNEMKSQVAQNIKKTSYDIIVCADEEIFNILHESFDQKHNIVVLECSSIKTEDKIIKCGVYCDAENLGRYAAKFALESINDKKNHMTLEGYIFNQ